MAAAVGASSSSASSTQPSSRLKARDTSRGELTDTSPHAVVDFNTGEGEDPDQKPCHRHDPHIALGLRIAAVCSQLPMLRLWPDFRCAVIYVIVVVVAEILSARVLAARLRGAGENSPLVGGHRFVQPLLATTLKLVLIFFVYAPIAAIAAAAMSSKASTSVSAFSSNFTAIGSGACYALYIGLDSYRGWLENKRRCV